MKWELLNMGEQKVWKTKISYCNSQNNLSSDRKLFSKQFCILFCFRLNHSCLFSAYRTLSESSNLKIFNPVNQPHLVWRCKVRIKIAHCIPGWLFPLKFLYKNEHVLGEWVYVTVLMKDSNSNIKASGIFLLNMSLSMCLIYTC